VRIVLGLGNPGPRYDGTRHNVGFRTLDLLARRAGVRFAPSPLEDRVAWSAEAALAGQEVVLAKPRTFMNLSGRAALLLCRRYRCAPQDLLVVFDDADLALGRVRIRRGGSAGGHNGIRSLLDTLRSQEFVRVKLGVKGTDREGQDLADYVLTSFAPDERPVVEAMLEVGADAVEEILARGLESAMNAFNGKVASP